MNLVENSVLTATLTFHGPDGPERIDLVKRDGRWSVVDTCADVPAKTCATTIEHDVATEPPPKRPNTPVESLYALARDIGVDVVEDGLTVKLRGVSIAGDGLDSRSRSAKATGDSRNDAASRLLMDVCGRRLLIHTPSLVSRTIKCPPIEAWAL